jgi:hypothetical protein
MLPSNMLLLNLIPLIDAIFSTPTADYTNYPGSAGSGVHVLFRGMPRSSDLAWQLSRMPLDPILSHTLGLNDLRFSHVLGDPLHIVLSALRRPIQT